MPVCFQLLKKGEPQKFNVVDDAICAHFGVVPDEKQYYFGWYDAIGFRVALGHTFEEIRAEFVRLQAERPESKPDKAAELKMYYGRLVEILDFLKANYESSSWYEMK